MSARTGVSAPAGRPERVIRRAIRMGADLKGRAATAVTLTAIATIAKLLIPLAIRAGVDDGIERSDAAVIAQVSLLGLGLLIIQYIAQRVAYFAVARLGEEYLANFRGQIFSSLMRLDMPFYGRSKAGVLVARMTSDIESMTEFVNEGAVMALSNALTAVGVAVFLVLVDWQLALPILGVIGLLIVISAVFQRWVSRSYAQVRERIGGVLALLQEGITGVRVVQAFTQESGQARAFRRINERYFEANMGAARAISKYFPMVSFLRSFAVGIVLALGGRRVIDGTLTFGTLVAFLLYLNWFFMPIINLANVYNLGQSAVAALHKLFAVVDTPIEVAQTPDAVSLRTPVEGRLELASVSFGYEPGSLILEDLDLVVPAGQRLAVVGETGAGKSTVAKLLMRFYDPSQGSVLLDDQDLRTLTHASRAASIALIPQDDFLFNQTLRENIRFGRPDADDTAIWSVCETMGIDDWLRSLPEGLDTEVRERGSRFSSGERQLVALARAFLVDPDVIVLDEATSNLDPQTELSVEHALRKLLSGRTSVVIAHRLRSAERADRIIMIDAGSIIADGTHDELLQSSDAYGELVAVWERGLSTGNSATSQ
jgi:ATP-binding cassette, subfamily B, bacterial